MTALNRVRAWPVGAVSAGWIDNEGRRSTLGLTTASFALASVTKPLFAYAVLIAVEEGTLALDQPAGPEGSTIRHLLSHSSGLATDSMTPLTGVGRRRIYSNSGFEELGRQLGAASGIEPARYLHEAVVEPLGLTSTRLEGSVAHGARSSVDDLLTLAAEWLRPTLVAPQTLAVATGPHLPGLPGVVPGYGRHDDNAWGLGYEIKASKAPHWTGSANTAATFGHFGRAGTYLWIDPPLQLGCVVLTDREFGPWALSRWPELNDAVIAEAAGPAAKPA
jgi:CubicO group peptidase (beta-lactamase class C family)